MRAGDNYAAGDVPAVALPAVPDVPPRTGRTWWLAALPAVGSLGAVGFLALAPRSPFIYVAGGLIVLVSIGMVAGNYVQSAGERRESREEVRARFLAALEETRTAIRAREVQVRTARARARISGEDLLVPISVGDLRVPSSPIEVGRRADPFCRSRLEQLVDRTAVIHQVPVPQALAARTVLSGAALATNGLLRQLLRRVIEDLGPDEVRIAVLTAKPHRWRALRWAPHHRHPTLHDDVGPARLVAADALVLAELLADLTGPVLLIADNPGQVPAELEQRVRWLVLTCLSAEQPHLLLEPGGRLRAGSTDLGTPTPCSPAELEAACRAAARSATVPAPGSRQTDAIDAPLRPVLGSNDDGAVHLDIRETSRGGTGPHGLLIGATGSGKSEVLRSVVCGLISVHPPAELSLLLVDFKGGATFTPFQSLPHTAAVITNLEDDPALVDRMRTALTAELRRRQRVLKSARAASVEELPRGTVLPRLVVVVDEFSELLTAHPDILEVLVQIGRLGRSLGVHLLVAAQRLDEGRVKGLDSHLTYRIALRTQSPAESRAVIGTADAAALANAPGSGFLRRGSSPPVAFRARFTGAYLGRHHDPAAAAPGILHYVNGPLARAPQPASGTTVLSAAISAARAMPGRRLPIWVPPPSHSPSHHDLYPDLSVRPVRGYGTLTGTATRAAIGIVDRPDLQRVDPAAIDLAAGHLAIVGTTRSGTTTAAVSTLLSLALRSTPAELHLYLVEASTAALGELRGLPHVAAYAGGEPDRVRAAVRRVAAIVDERENHAGSADPPRPMVVLAVDGYARLRDAHQSLEPALLDVAQRGLAVGVHVVLTTHRWFDLRSRLRELVGNRIELRLGDPIESEIDRRAAALVPRARPGRGLTPDGHPLYVARADVANLVATIDRSWTGARARGLAELPPVLTTRNIDRELAARGLCLAVERAVGRAVVLSEEAPYCLVIGDPGSGRTAVLRSLAVQDARRGARLLVVDPRRRLLGSLPGEHLLGYAATPAAVTELVTGLSDGLARRMPPADITTDQLRDRSWWDGPRLHLIVDDHDLVTLVGASLAPLRRFLPYAADIGLRLTIARRAAGAAAALHDETLSVLRDLGATALLLSRAVDEGPLLGVRPGPAAWGTGVLLTPARSPLDVQAIVEPVPTP